MLFMNTYDDYDFDEFIEYEGETYIYKLLYFTYYDENTKKFIELYEYTDSDEIFSYTDSNIENDIEKCVKQIKDDIQNGCFTGLCVHTITIEIISSYKQIDVDDWDGKSFINSHDTETEEIELNDDELSNMITDSNEIDVDYLTQICQNYIDDI